MSDTSDLSFADLNLPEPLLAALSAVGYETPSPIQAATIPMLMQGKDVVGMAQTGTGKTAAFAIPLLASIDLKKRKPQALVLCPTRELAIQVAEAFQSYASQMKGFHVLPLYGGQDMRTQLRALQRTVHVIVATPGRLIDHIQRRSIDLSELDSLVLDEADEMLRMGFIDDVETILQATPDDRRVALFSATMPAPIRRVAEKYLNNPEEIRIETAVTTNENIEQFYWLVSGTNKLDALTRILEVEDFDGMIIFVRTKTATVELADKLNARGFSAAPLNGDMNQQLRVRTVDQLKGGQLDIVIATDVAARGLDVERISHVMNFDIPYDDEAYVHRIGRTGRAGRSGKAILFVAPRERRLLRSIEKTTRQKIEPMSLPSRADLIDKRSQDFKAQVVDALANQEERAFFQNIVTEICHDNEASAEEVATALVYLLQQKRPLMPPPEKFNKPKQDRFDDRDRGDRRDRKDRGERVHNSKDERKGKNKKGRKNETGVPMESFKIHVGHKDEVTPREIVGAIANEAGIEGKHIGQIKIRDSFTIVDLPAGMPKEVFQTLKKTRVCQKPLNIERDEFDSNRAEAKEFDGRPPKKKDKKVRKANKKKDKR
ncbi:DEAD/DEAH box helicase [Teredinibacter sp. KSP-S5-2]|uniref:DEAD/DEAH box helicase n=1 Tax=Teredinibacter sp. KSP-S5-2 TaxID=3034506 RepID=UPI0029348D85|nr:DEAD/DEAH box helicase [Teredinibacter sp. KSP-S5-2]WNO07748.1 DEAD/DEAH box helicase [Teredinibacter sp. KSP-S5-2]